MLVKLMQLLNLRVLLNQSTMWRLSGAQIWSQFIHEANLFYMDVNISREL